MTAKSSEGADEPMRIFRPERAVDDDSAAIFPSEAKGAGNQVAGHAGRGRRAVDA